MFLGVISPKISKNTVTVIVMMDMVSAILVYPKEFSRSKSTAVANAVAATLAILLPTRMPVNNF